MKILAVSYNDMSVWEVPLCIVVQRDTRIANRLPNHRLE